MGGVFFFETWKSCPKAQQNTLLSASQWRILMTKWAVQAWKKINGTKELIIRSFKKWGLSVALDGSENAQVSIDDIPNCKMLQRFVEEEYKLIDDNEDDDEDAGESNENDEFDLLTDQEIPLFVEHWL